MQPLATLLGFDTQYEYDYANPIMLNWEEEKLEEYSWADWEMKEEKRKKAEEEKERGKGLERGQSSLDDSIMKRK